MNLSDIATLNNEGSGYCCMRQKWGHKLNANCRFDRKKWNIKHKNLLSRIKIGKEIVTFGNIEIEKTIFYLNRTPTFPKDVDIEKVLVSNKISFGEKNCNYFIGYLHNDNKVKPLHIMFIKTSAFIKRYDGQTKWMQFLIENDDLLKKYNTILDKVSADIKKSFIASLSTIKRF